MSARWTLLVANFVASLVSFAYQAAADETAPAPRRAEVTVGGEDADFQGRDGRVLQAAVDYLHGLGGGTVRIGPGRFTMRNSLTLHDNIRVIGVPGQTILVAADAHQTPLASSGGCNERQISVADPSGFRVGDGIMVQDDKSKFGFSVTQATITAQLDKHTFQISRPLYFDYSPGRNARATSAFPIVGLWNVKNALVEGLTIDGNGERMHYLTGCRGGGIYLFECQDVAIRNCTVKNYNGDGISFQTTERVLVEDCVCTGNSGVGLHPGCGTEHAVVRGNRCVNNEGDGLFVCWRVKHTLFADNDFSENRRHGISIGHKDSDNLFRNNRILKNAESGVFFRKQTETGGAHRNVFQGNRIVDNGKSIVIQGHHHDLVFRKNTIGQTKPGNHAAAVVAEPQAKGLDVAENELLNVKPK